MALDIVLWKPQVNHGLEGLCVYLEILATAVVWINSFTLIIWECFLLLFLFLLFLLIYIYVFVILSLRVVGVICYLCYVVYYVYIIIYCLSVFPWCISLLILLLNIRTSRISVRASIKLRVVAAWFVSCRGHLMMILSSGRVRLPAWIWNERLICGRIKILQPWISP